MKRFVFPALQLIGTLLIVTSAASNANKAVLLPCFWLLAFQPIRTSEFLLYFALCVFFTTMDILSVAQGVFFFDHPDILGLPLYEPLMWGFYILHTLRFFGDRAPQGSVFRAALLAVPFATAFGCIADPHLLLAVTGGLLTLGLILFHEPGDLACVAHMILIGALFEYAGVCSGQWHYAHPPVGGVPLWFVTLWGGVGLMTRRLVLPLSADIAQRFKKQTRPIASMEASV
jgi:hypothetical protein